MIAALLEKDIKLFFRNQFNLVITILSLGMFIAVFLLLPDNVDQTLDLALYVGDGVPQTLADRFGEPIEAAIFDNEDDLIAAIDNGDYPVGLALTAAAATGQDAYSVYYAPGTNENVRRTYNDVLSSILSIGAGTPVLVNETVEVLGPVHLDEPTPLRNRLIPMLLLVIYAVEMMGLAGLIVEEIEAKTAQGLLTTPLGMGQFFTAKAMIGVGLAFSQSFLLLLVVGELFSAPLILIVTLLLSGLFISGLAFLVAALSEDYVTVMGWSILVILLLMIPAITLVAPGIANDFINLIPSFFFIDTVHQTVNLEGTWGDVTTNLIALFVVSIVLLGASSLLLRRRLS
jgi:ABC-2 type transport system permease protein